jgi:hypothetical protein
MLSEQIVHAFQRFLALRICNPWHATKTFLEYLQSGTTRVYLRGEKSHEKDDTNWYVQLSFSGCGGMAETSAELAYHWAELWVQHDIQRINDTILQPEGFTAYRQLQRVDDPISFVPVGTPEYSVYAAVSLRSDEQKEFDVDASVLEIQEDLGDGFLAKIREQLSGMMADGNCRCQLCMPDYSPVDTVAI